MTYDATGNAGAGTGVGDQSPTDQAKEKASEVAGQAQEKARGVLEGQVEQRSEQAAEKVESVADDVRAVSESLSDRGQDAAARIVEQGADYAQQLSDYLRNSSSDAILDDVASFARKQPWVVAGGGLLLGFAASRVLRASAQNDSGYSSPSTATSDRYAISAAPPVPTYSARAETGTFAAGTYDAPTYETGTATYSSGPYDSTESQIPPVTSSVDGR